MTFITIGQTLAIIVCMATICRPLSYFWDRYYFDIQGTCNDDALFLLISGITNASIDVALLITPIPQILKLNISAKKKAAVCGIMLLGCV